MKKVKTPSQISLKEKLMRWDLKAVNIQGKNLGGTNARSRYGVCSNIDDNINLISRIVKNMVDVDNMAWWSDDLICIMTGLQPPFT